MHTINIIINYLSAYLNHSIFYPLEFASRYPDPQRQVSKITHICSQFDTDNLQLFLLNKVRFHSKKLLDNSANMVILSSLALRGLTDPEVQRVARLAQKNLGSSIPRG